MTDEKDTRQTLADLIEQQHLSGPHILQAICIAEITPNANQWQNFMAGMLFWFGSIAFAFSLIFFVAANWQDIGVMAKFALIEVAIIIAMVIYLKFNHRQNIRQASLVICMLLVGGLMALFGQTYQTGADPWQLFFNWALLTIPWVLISRFSVIWLIWIGLLNLALYLYLETYGGYLDNPWAQFLLNSVALVAWQSAAAKFSWLNKTWAIELLALVSGGLAVWVLIAGLFENQPFGILLWVIWAGVMFYVYRWRLLNVFILAIWSLTILIGANAVLVRIIPSNFDAFFFLLLSFLTIAGGTYLTVWLKGLNKASCV